MNRDSILRHVTGVVRYHDPTLDRVAAVLPSPLMPKPATARWDLEVSATDVTQLKLGFAGSNQDHKWTIAANDLDDNGLVPIHIIQRGWNADRYILHHLGLGIGHAWNHGRFGAAGKRGGFRLVQDPRWFCIRKPFTL